MVGGWAQCSLANNGASSVISGSCKEAASGTRCQYETSLEGWIRLVVGLNALWPAMG